MKRVFIPHALEYQSPNWLPLDEAVRPIISGQTVILHGDFHLSDSQNFTTVSVNVTLTVEEQEAIRNVVLLAASRALSQLVGELHALPKP